jgi:hypothetical protein
MLALIYAQTIMLWQMSFLTTVSIAISLHPESPDRPRIYDGHRDRQADWSYTLPAHHQPFPTFLNQKKKERQKSHANKVKALAHALLILSPLFPFNPFHALTNRAHLTNGVNHTSQMPPHRQTSESQTARNRAAAPAAPSLALLPCPSPLPFSPSVAVSRFLVWSLHQPI